MTAPVLEALDRTTSAGMPQASACRRMVGASPTLDPARTPGEASLGLRGSRPAPAILGDVERIEAIRRVVESRADVRLAYVFGSAARDQARASSDVDIAVLLEPLPAPADLDRLATDLETVAGRRVDLVVLNTAPPLLAHEVIKTGQRLTCRSEAERVRFETHAAARYLDTAHLRRVQHRYLRERAEAFRARQS